MFATWQVTLGVNLYSLDLQKRYKGRLFTPVTQQGGNTLIQSGPRAAPELGAKIADDEVSPETERRTHAHN